jgi:hypothetical protein
VAQGPAQRHVHRLPGRLFHAERARRGHLHLAAVLLPERARLLGHRRRLHARPAQRRRTGRPAGDRRPHRPPAAQAHPDPPGAGLARRRPAGPVRQLATGTGYLATGRTP